MKEYYLVTFGLGMMSKEKTKSDVISLVRDLLKDQDIKTITIEKKKP